VASHQVILHAGLWKILTIRSNDMMRVRVQWDFDELAGPSEDGTHDVLEALGYTWNDVLAAQQDKLQKIHNDIAYYFNIPVKLDIPFSQEDLTDDDLTLGEVVADYLSDRFGWCVESWEEIEA
jgi:hypothetical protein